MKRFSTIHGEKPEFGNKKHIEFLKYWENVLAGEAPIKTRKVSEPEFCEHCGSYEGEEDFIEFDCVKFDCEETIRIEDDEWNFNPEEETHCKKCRTVYRVNKKGNVFYTDRLKPKKKKSKNL